MLTHYEVLEISESASAEVIRAAYRSLSGKYHPDRDKSVEGRERFQQIQKAFDVLSDEARRREYDCSRRSHRPQQPTAESIVMRVDGTSSFLTLSEHLKRKGAELAKCDLSGIDLRGISLRGGNLSGAKLDGGAFAGCDFRNANLTNCSAQSCDFDETQFSGANLTGANFRGSSMIKATFYQLGPIMGTTEKLELRRFAWNDRKSRVVDKSVETNPTTLDDADFSQCDMRGAVFVAPPAAEETTSTRSAAFGVERNVPLFLRQTFASCTFRNCKLSKSNLHQVDLHGLNLSSVDLSGANLHGANLFGCNIEELDLSACNLVNANLHRVAYNTGTKLPKGYPLPGDAVDKDLERVDRIRAEEVRNREDAKVTVVIVMFFVFLFGLVGIALFLSPKASQPDKKSSSGLKHRSNEAAPQAPNDPKLNAATRGNQRQNASIVAIKPQPTRRKIQSAVRYDAAPPTAPQEPTNSLASNRTGVRIATRPLWLSLRDAAIQAASAGDFDQAIALAHRARAQTDFDNRVALAKLIREFDRQKREVLKSQREVASKR